MSAHNTTHGKGEVAAAEWLNWFYHVAYLKIAVNTFGSVETWADGKYFKAW